MKTTLAYRTVLYLATLLAGMLITAGQASANYIQPWEQDTVQVQVSTEYQTFDEALMIGLQLLHQLPESEAEVGIICIDCGKSKIHAEITLADLSNYNSNTELYQFVRTKVRFS